MFHPEGLMHRKINIWIALAVLTMITISAAFALSTRAAVFSWYFGGRIATVQPAGTCGCGPQEPPCLHGCPCGFHDVGIVPYRGGAKFVCVPASKPVPSAGLVPGATIFGGGYSSLSPVRIFTTR